MRFENPSIPSWIAWPLVVMTSPVWGALVALIAAEVYGTKLKRHLLGPHKDRWQKWFAWFPIRLDEGWGATVWLEMVERTSNHGTIYRLPTPPQDREEKP